MCKAVIPFKLVLHTIYRLLNTWTTWDSILQLDEPSIKHFQWWHAALTTWNGAPLHLVASDIQIETDASASRWGAVCIGKEASRALSTELQLMPSNCRELMAVHMAQLSFKDIIQGKVVQILTGKITMVANLNHLDGHCLMSDIAQAMWCTTHCLNVTVQVKHLTGILNCHADILRWLLTQYKC